MNNKILLTILFLAFSSISHAEDFVCFDSVTTNVKGRLRGDCLALGLCTGFNNSGLRSDCIIAEQQEYEKAGNRFTQVDASLSVGNRVIDMTQPEIDAILAAEVQAAVDAKNALRASLDDKFDGTALGDMTLTKIDAKIDAIANLTQAKAFLKLLVRGIIKLNGGE